MEARIQKWGNSASIRITNIVRGSVLCEHIIL